MRRVTQNELVFYDRLAERINVLLGRRECPLNQSSLAVRIGWNRASLCNFLNRIDKSIAAHFIPPIAQSLHVSLEHLISGAPNSRQEQVSWDPRWDEPQLILDKIAEWKQRNLPSISLHRTLPAWVMPTRAMLVNYVDSIFDGACPIAAERWQELKERMAGEGDHDDCDHIVFSRDLMRIPERRPPYHAFTVEEIAELLEHLKHESSHRKFRLIAADDSAWTADLRLEMAGIRSLTVLGREMRVECREDFRIQWSEDPKPVALTRECLARVKKSSGLRIRQDPSPHETRRVIDDLLLHMGVARENDREPEMIYPAGGPPRAKSSTAAFAAARERRESALIGA